MHFIDKDPMTPEMKTNWDKVKANRASSTMTSTPKKDSLGTALRKKMSAPLTKAIRHIPNKHHEYKMAKSDKDYNFLKDYNSREKSGAGNSDKDRAIFNMYKDRK